MRIALELDDGTGCEAEVSDAATNQSQHTGRELRDYEVEITVGGNAPAAFWQLVERGVRIEGTPFRARVASTATHGNSSSMRYTIELTEAELLDCTSITIDGRVTVVPDRYREGKADAPEGIMVECFVTLDAADSTVIEELMSGTGSPVYFPIVRHGIQEQPRSVRFGRCLWSRTPDGYTQHYLVFVEEVADQYADEPSAVSLFGQPRRDRVADAIVTMQETIGALVDVLQSSSAIAAADATRLRQFLVGTQGEGLRQFNYAPDLDPYW